MRVAAAVILITLAFAGCGGSSKHGGTTGALAATPPGSTSTPAATTTTSTTATKSGKHGKHGKGSGHSANRGGSGTTGGSGSPAIGSSGTAAPPPPVPPSFAAQADAICGNYRKSVAGLSSGTTFAAQVKVFSQLLQAANGAVDQLERLTPPASDAAYFRRYTALTTSAMKDFVAAQTRGRSTKESQGTAISAKDYATFRKLGHTAAAASKLAREMGMHVCGSSGSDWL